MGSVLARDRFSKAQAWPGYTVVVLLIIRYRIYEFEYLATTAATYRRVRRRPAASSAFEGITTNRAELVANLTNDTKALSKRNSKKELEAR